MSSVYVSGVGRLNLSEPYLSSRDERNRANRPAKIVESPSIFCKDTISRRCKCKFIAFCRGGVSKTKSKITNKPSAKANLFAFCRGGVSKTKSKIAKAEKKTGACSQFSEAYPIFCKDTIFSPISKERTPSTNGKRPWIEIPQPSFRIFRKTHPKTAVTAK